MVNILRQVAAFVQGGGKRLGSYSQFTNNLFLTCFMVMTGARKSHGRYIKRHMRISSHI